MVTQKHQQYQQIPAPVGSAVVWSCFFNRIELFGRRAPKFKIKILDARGFISHNKRYNIREPELNIPLYHSQSPQHCGSVKSNTRYVYSTINLYRIFIPNRQSVRGLERRCNDIIISLPRTCSLFSARKFPAGRVFCKSVFDCLLFLQAFASFNGKENEKKNRLLFGKCVIMTSAISE